MKRKLLIVGTIFFGFISSISSYGFQPAAALENMFLNVAANYPIQTCRENPLNTFCNCMNTDIVNGCKDEGQPDCDYNHICNIMTTACRVGIRNSCLEIIHVVPSVNLSTCIDQFNYYVRNVNNCYPSPCNLNNCNQ